MKRLLLIAAGVVAVFSFVYGEKDFKRAAAAKSKDAASGGNAAQLMPARASGIMKK